MVQDVELTWVGLLKPVQVIKVSEAICSVGLTPLLVVHPYNHLINSIIIYRVEPNKLHQSRAIVA